MVSLYYYIFGKKKNYFLFLLIQDYPFPTPMPWVGCNPPAEAAQGSIQHVLENLQGWGICLGCLCQCLWVYGGQPNLEGCCRAESLCTSGGTDAAPVGLRHQKDPKSMERGCRPGEYLWDDNPWGHRKTHESETTAGSLGSQGNVGCKVGDLTPVCHPCQESPGWLHTLSGPSCVAGVIPHSLY